MTTDKPLSIAEVAEMADLSVSSIRYAVRSGKLAAYEVERIGGTLWQIEKADAIRFIEARNAAIVNRPCKVCGDEASRDHVLCSECLRYKTTEERKHKRSKKHATHVTVTSERLGLRPIVTERQQEIALLAALQLYAVAQLSERPIIRLKELAMVLRRLGVLAKGERVISLLSRAEESGWLDTIYQDHRRDASGDALYETTGEVGSRTGRTPRWVTVMCQRGKIEGAKKVGEGKRTKWLIPRGWEP